MKFIQVTQVIELAGTGNVEVKQLLLNTAHIISISPISDAHYQAHIRVPFGGIKTDETFQELIELINKK